MIANLTDTQIDDRLNMVETLIHRERDTQSLAALSDVFRLLIDEQVRRDLENEIASEQP